MPVFLALTPSALPAVRTLQIPKVHMAYAIGEGGRLLRSALPQALRSGLLGLSDHGGALPEDTAPLCRALVRECTQRRFGGVVADFEGARRSDRLALLSRLGASLAQSGRQLYVPERFAVPEATVLICTAVSGGTLRECFAEAAARYGNRIALDVERLAMDFTLPCRSGEGTPLTRAALDELREGCGASVFFSAELCANYFSYHADGRLHFVLFDTAETLRRKLALARERGIETAFLQYPEVSDLLPALLPL